MAGTYPDIPGTRFALDQDGTILKMRNFTAGGPWTDETGSLPALLMLGTDSYISYSTPINGHYVQLSFAFPEARSITGVYIHATGSIEYNRAAGTPIWEWSSDTTDGTDGTWATFTATFTNYSMHNYSTHQPKPFYRTDIAPLALSNVKGIRVRWISDSSQLGLHRIYDFHLYGSRPVVSVDRLAFWHPTLDQAIAPAALDFGDIPQGYSGTRQFRIKNLSATLTANSVDVQLSDPGNLYDAAELELSNDNVTFVGSISIGTLAPNSISGTKYLRRTVPISEPSTQNHARLITNAASWT